MEDAHKHIIDYTVAHFMEIARQNRFAENSRIAHDKERCGICHPEKTGMEPFRFYLHVITQAIKVRRPCLDEDLVEQMNEDLSMMGISETVSLEQVIEGKPNAVDAWKSWAWNALSTGIALLSMHSDTAHEFDLDEEEEKGRGEWIQSSIREIMEHQRARQAELSKS